MACGNTIPDEVRQQMNDATSGPLPPANTPEYEAEIDRRLEASEAIRIAWEQGQAQQAFEDLVAAGVAPRTATALTCYTPPAPEES